MKMNFMLAVLSFGSALQAGAATSEGGLFLEPAITYQVSTTSTNYPPPFSNSSGNLDGFGLGGRVGFHLNEAFFLGLDLRYLMPKYKDSAAQYDADGTQANWGAVVGMQMPDFGFRVWAAAVLGGELNPKSSGSLDVKFGEATGYRVGAGFHLASFSLNLEYEQLKYGKTNLEQLGPFTSGSTLDSVNLEQKAWIASVSFPLEI